MHRTGRAVEVTYRLYWLTLKRQVMGSNPAVYLLIFLENTTFWMSAKLIKSLCLGWTTHPPVTIWDSLLFCPSQIRTPDKAIQWVILSNQCIRISTISSLIVLLLRSQPVQFIFRHFDKCSSFLANARKISKLTFFDQPRICWWMVEKNSAFVFPPKNVETSDETLSRRSRSCFIKDKALDVERGTSSVEVRTDGKM